ncbi:tyrosine-type recombinase/integrase [Streptomyces sp. NPDC058401]|uniref:tyrosine-type recombinase/integrase n=1 Tax=Streptomyces sp. NPDC058401 TaxID=3346480 RepID=UPI0036553313
MNLTYFSPAGWETWDLDRKPLIREGTPVLIDEDLRFEDNGTPRPTVAVNRWLRELPTMGVPAVKSWKAYAQALRTWLEFLHDRQVHPFADRKDLRAVLSTFAEYRFNGPLEARWDGSTWNNRITIVAGFYKWALREGLCTDVPFTYAQVTHYSSTGPNETTRNLATVRRAKPHVTVKYLEADFKDLFLRGLAGLTPDGEEDTAPNRFRGRHLGRNAAMGRLVVSSGLRAQEFTHLLTYEIPALPARRTRVPIRWPLAKAVTKGTKPRETWIDYGTLAEVRQYIDLDRDVATYGSTYQPEPRLGDPLVIADPHWEGARVNGRTVSWRRLGPIERRRLVAPDGTSPLVALQSNGEPFIDWGTVFRRTSQRIRERFEPRFPTVTPHTLRHTFAMATMEALIKGYYQQAAQLVVDADEDAALALYLTKAEPILVLRDLLGHSSTATTEVYLMRLDTQRIFREAYKQAGSRNGLLGSAARDEAAEEFDDEGGI